MLLMLSVPLGLLLILGGTAAVAQRNKLRESRRSQARSLSLALAASERYRQYTCRPESAGVA
jgi:hypothetical protein